LRQNGLVPFPESDLDPEIARRLKPAAHAADGRPLVAAVAQEAQTGRVLMLAWMDAAALARTLRTGEATYYSRSRQEQWVKGATSGNTQRVARVELDCDGDTILLHVAAAGPACHVGTTSCFDATALLSEVDPG
jgi:phosphoribosyl-AMP cyclohydrolase